MSTKKGGAYVLRNGEPVRESGTVGQGRRTHKPNTQTVEVKHANEKKGLTAKD